MLNLSTVYPDHASASPAGGKITKIPSKNQKIAKISNKNQADLAAAAAVLLYVLRIMAHKAAMTVIRASVIRG
jgi:hypothetical protein